MRTRMEIRKLENKKSKVKKLKIKSEEDVKVEPCESNEKVETMSVGLKL